MTEMLQFVRARVFDYSVRVHMDGECLRAMSGSVMVDTLPVHMVFKCIISKTSRGSALFHSEHEC